MSAKKPASRDIHSLLKKDGTPSHRTWPARYAEPDVLERTVHMANDLHHVDGRTLKRVAWLLAQALGDTA